MAVRPDGSTSTLAGLQARLQAGTLGSLGVMLGEAASSAQSRFETFGDYLPTSALSTSLLSSFSKNVAKK